MICVIDKKSYEKAIEEIIKIVKQKKINNKKDLLKVKRKICKKYGLERMISDSEIYSRDNMEIFSRKPSRKASGVSVVAVMTSPAKCPHGRCVFCPGGVTENTPQSYTGEEPAALRAKMNDYDPYMQVQNRLKQYYIIGQKPEKVELIIMGGTFTHRKLSYQEWFIKSCFEALNGKRAKSLTEAQKMNERALHRCVGLTIETRPDEIDEKTIKRMLRYGATRVELGVQSTYERVLKISKRGHTVKDSINATKLLKNNGFKINYHMMLNLPGSNIKKDFKSFKRLFDDTRFRPDMLKIYPTLLIKGTELYEMYKRGEWKPYTKEEVIKLIAKIKTIVPKYVRIMRVQRDVPSFKIEQDLKNSNLRQLVHKELQNMNKRCNCIRCREAGRNNADISTARLKSLRYRASEGDEYFIEYSDKKDYLFGLVRARIPDNKDIMFIRELHVYGEQIPLGKKGSIQHRGIGKMLMSKAEEIAKKRGLKRIDVISGVGVREYYRKLGYKKRGYYMSKFI